MAVFRQHCFRMKLKAIQRIFPVGKSHNRAILRQGVYPELPGDGAPLHYQGMVAGDRIRLRQALKKPFSPVTDPGHFTVHGPASPNNASSKSVADNLMTQANAQNGNSSCEMADCLL